MFLVVSLRRVDNRQVFFKWIKQHLRIKSFYSNSENAVKTQTWIAIGVYVLVASAKKRLQIDASHYSFLQVLGVTAFEKGPILHVFQNTHPKIAPAYIANQLSLIDF